MLSFLSTIFGFIYQWFFRKSQGEKAIDAVVEQKDAVIKEVEDAKKITDRLDSDKSFNDSVRAKYQRD